MAFSAISPAAKRLTKPGNGMARSTAKQRSGAAAIQISSRASSAIGRGYQRVSAVTGRPQPGQRQRIDGHEDPERLDRSGDGGDGDAGDERAEEGPADGRRGRTPQGEQARHGDPLALGGTYRRPAP